MTISASTAGLLSPVSGIWEYQSLKCWYSVNHLSSRMAFIGGGRACIGFKFSKLEMKMVLCILLQTFKFTSAQEIEWTTQVSYPKVKGSDNAKWQLPLRVEMVST
ncbi:uncharacterized protein EDB91DRAFT_1167316 [Suillus paluster]|uniref:uncharacterized protein n=1 Tax=Suillus paluster TaxID=48578 RepID=UPI001B8837C2|nr:uncharacterized protein EDB91DRAFT_1167316 [Suillus paluster]KAG1725802.1 hypothetical protein EDB91DRAFT_1167316 [Suillus paluster]